MYKLETSINNSISLNTIMIIYIETKIQDRKGIIMTLLSIMLRKTIIIIIGMAVRELAKKFEAHPTFFCD